MYLSELYGRIGQMLQEHGDFKEEFLYDGRYSMNGECMLFPSKGKTTWERFHRPFRDGDIIYVRDEYSDATYTYVAILKQIENFGEISSHCFYNYEDDVFGTNDFLYDSCNMRFATEKEKEKLFKVIKDKGYRWNAESKTLEKLIEHEFHEGNWVVNKFGDVWQIDSFDSKNYQVSNGDKYNYFPIEKQNEMHLWTINDAKDGDVLVTVNDENRPFIYKGCLDPNHPDSPVAYCGINADGYFCSGGGKFNHWWTVEKVQPATKEQCKLLFQKIKEAGYKWNIETKTLEKLIELKFKVGDKIRGKYTHNIYTISCITPTEYNLTNGQSFTFNAEDCYELVPDKFDITTLKPFAEVLVRNTNNGHWRAQLYMSYNENKEYPFECIYNCWKQCIPYENNEHLFNKTDDCTDYFKTWE